MLIVALVFGSITARSRHRGFISVASQSIGGDLITVTNSSHLVRIDPDVRARLAELLGARTWVADVLLGDAPSPIGDGTACSRLILTNELGKSLLIRLRPVEESGMFEVLK